ncbi:hypothetical protein Q1695_011900 [Nippostrongylus brasiliensis]|nr:hypothetical protein Q1695_011900 [Nippostrongylus brasiliensis]
MLFRLLLATAVVIKAAIVHPDTPNYLSRKLRDLRMSLTDRVAEFLSAYPQRAFSGCELEGVLQYMVVPYLSDVRNIRDEQTVVAPLSVVKMLAAVSAYPTHYHILALQFEWSNHRGALMELLVSPLLWPGRTQHMLNIIRKALLNLLTLADEPLAVSELQYENITREKGQNYGTSLVVSHINPVIQYLADAVEDSVKKFNAINLELLNKLAAYAKDGDLARNMTSTILGHLENKLPKESTLKQLLDVIGCLISNVAAPQQFLRRIAPLFSKIEGRVCHESLVRVVEGLIRNDGVGNDVKKHLKEVLELESWDRSRIDEPDHERRHAAYKRLNQIWNSNAELHVDVLRIFCHTHFHTFSGTKDISLRASAASNLRSLIQYIARSKLEDKEKTSLISDDLIHLYVLGMKSQNEVVREECVKCLVTLVDSFPDHPQLAQLSALRNVDEDLDFFSNVNHIQSHRRQRAIHRLVEQLSTEKVVIGYDILNKFLIPLSLPYLATTESKLSALSDECLRLLKYTMGIAVWSKYVACLDYWLKRLDSQEENQKAAIRVIVAVIDAFHYDVADVGETVEEAKSNEKSILIRDKLVKDTLPKLSRCINGKSAELSVHRKARTATTKHYSEDDDIQRAPVALATVKLLQKTPESIRSQYLHGVILKLCSLMISRSMNVRETARKVGVQVCECLGPKFLPVIIKEMKLIMKKGFQVHVMIYTVHTFLGAMRDTLRTGDLDPCLDDVIDIVVQEQFEAVSEEKEVGEIKAEVSEAKKNPTPGTMLLLGRYVSSAVVGTLLNRFVSVVDSLTSAKLISRARNLLSMFANGLKENQGFSPSLQLVLIHQMITSNMAKMSVVPESQREADELAEKQKSCLLLPPEPKRIGVMVKPQLKCRSHIFLEFALQLLGALIKGKQFDKDDEEAVRMLDPFVELVTKSLEFKYEKVISHALRCLTGMMHMGLPSIEKSLKNISERLFLLLSEYSILGSAANKESVLNLNQLLCKTFTQLIITSTADFLTDKHVSLLLSYVEIDVLESNRQATAFALIKAFVRRKVVHPQMREVMKKLRELAITSPFPHIRTQCREVLCDFIGNHPSSDDPQKHIEWFIAQLDYELEDGRLSAVDMLNSLFSRLQPAVLNGSCFFNVSKMGTSLFNEENPKCRRFISAALNKLLSSVDEPARSDVFAACCDWLELRGEEQEGARSIAAELLSQISKVEGEAFVTRFPVVLPALREIVTSNSLWTENSERTISDFCRSLSSVLLNLGAAAVQVLVTEDFGAIFDALGPLMKCNGSESVRLSAACLIGQYLCNYDSLFTTERTNQVIQWCCWQLRDKALSENVALQASKILMAVSHHLNDEQFRCLVEKLASICRFEIIHQPNASLKRITCFKMAAALVIHQENVAKVDITATFFFPLLVREMNRKSSRDTEELCAMATEVGEVFKGKLGEEKYTTLLAECQKAAVLKTEERKRKAKELAVTNPEEASVLKRKKNVKKTESRKRKIDVLKPYRVMNREHTERRKIQENEE